MPSSSRARPTQTGSMVQRVRDVSGSYPTVAAKPPPQVNFGYRIPVSRTCTNITLSSRIGTEGGESPPQRGQACSRRARQQLLTPVPGVTRTKPSDVYARVDHRCHHFQDKAATD